MTQMEQEFWNDYKDNGEEAVEDMRVRLDDCQDLLIKLMSGRKVRGEYENPEEMIGEIEEILETAGNLVGRAN